MTADGVAGGIAPQTFGNRPGLLLLAGHRIDLPGSGMSARVGGAGEVEAELPETLLYGCVVYAGGGLCLPGSVVEATGNVVESGLDDELVSCGLTRFKTGFDGGSLKHSRTPIVMVTAYDYPSARAAKAAAVDIVLVGDSGAMTVLGYPSTVAVGIEEMLMLTAATRRGTTSALLVADLPFGSYEVSDQQAVATAVRFVKEAGADAVKLEGGGSMSVHRAAAVVAAGVPVMGHVGLTPQTATALGGYRAQGRSADSAISIARGAFALQECNCSN